MSYLTLWPVRPGLFRCVRGRLPARSPRRLRPVRASSQTSKTTPTKGTKSYAGLHDFCMTIPYATVVSVAGVSGLLTGAAGQTALLMTAAGVASAVAAALSLKVWKVNGNNRRYTIASSGLALGVAAMTWRSIRRDGAQLLVKCLFAISVAMVLFLLYNLVAGGNAPKRH